MASTYVMCLCLVALCVAVYGRSISEPNVDTGSDTNVLLRVKRNIINGSPGNGCSAGYYRKQPGGQCYSCDAMARRLKKPMKVCHDRCVSAHVSCDKIKRRKVYS